MEQLTRVIAPGLTLNWPTLDEYYVGEIPGNFRGWATGPRGQSPKEGWKGRHVDNLTRFRLAVNRRHWQGVSLRRLILDNQEGEVRAGQVSLVQRGDLSQRTYWLIGNVTTHAVKYFIWNASADAPVEKLLRVAFTRWTIGHSFRVVKSEIGFGHFEGRSQVFLMRHMILCLIVMGFVAEHTD